MELLSEEIQLLINLGFDKIKPEKWRIKKDDYGWIYLDFCKSSEGISSAWDKYDGWLSADIVEEMGPIAEFRKRRLDIKKGIPISSEELRRMRQENVEKY